jgi:antitoxin VapB
LVENHKKVDFLEVAVSLNIKNPTTVALVDEPARRQGISKTAAIHQAPTERLHRLGHADISKDRTLDELRAIRERITRLPELETRSDEEIVGFD